jgi:hypothetical protein
MVKDKKVKVKPKVKPKRGRGRPKKVKPARAPGVRVEHVFNNDEEKQKHLEQMCYLAELSAKLWQLALKKAIPRLISAASNSYRQTLENIQLIDPHRAQALAQAFAFLDFGDGSEYDSPKIEPL